MREGIFLLLAIEATLGCSAPELHGAGPAPLDAGAREDAGSSVTHANDAGGSHDAPDSSIGSGKAGADSGIAGSDAGDASASAQRMAIPMYIDPSAPDWARVRGAAPIVSLLIANPNSGPGSAVDASYTQAIASAHAAGQTIVGYVHTSYGARAIADVEADIDAWYTFYPAIDGVFSDETATGSARVPTYYAPLYAYVKAKSGQRIVVINPGVAPDEPYMTVADIVLSYEDSYAKYASAEPPAWVRSYPPSRFWNIVLSASQHDMEAAIVLARQRNVGIIYVTDQGPSTAYQTIVASSYWQAELAAVAAP